MVSPLSIDAKWLLGIRLGCFAAFLLTAIDINTYSLAFFLMTIVSLYGLVKKTVPVGVRVREVDLSKTASNPFKKSRQTAQIPDELLNKAKNELFDLICSTDFSSSPTLELFAELKNNSDCLFAKSENSKKSKLWASQLWNNSLNIQENIRINIFPSFNLFSIVHQHLNLDGYLVQLPGPDVDSFARGFCALLQGLAAIDPSGKNCMQSLELIESPKWAFEFNQVTFFVTTFAPFYPSNHSRFAFGLTDGFVLFQPEVSFARHNLPPDTPITNWLEPKTVRDRIRVQFKKSGREYLIRETVNYPMSHDMIKPVEPGGKPVEWWRFAARV